METPPPQFQVPPPYQAQKPRSGSKLWLLAVLLICVPCVILIGVMGYLFKQGVGMVNKELVPLMSCAANFDLLREAAKDYANDHDGKLPDSKTWQKDVISYYKKRFMADYSKANGEIIGLKLEFKEFDEKTPFSCDNPHDPDTGFAYNSDLSGKKIADIKDPTTTFMFFEVEKVELNHSEAYKPRDKATSPKMFDRRRDWIRVPINGDMEFDTKTRRMIEKQSDSLKGSMEEFNDAKEQEAKADAGSK